MIDNEKMYLLTLIYINFDFFVHQFVEDTNFLDFLFF